MELKRDEIIKALECCHSHSHKHCSKCPYNEDTEKACFMLLMEHSLALINSQEQRIKELAEENENLHASCTELTRKCASLTEDNERLRCEVADLKDELKCEKETNAHLCSQYMSENHLRYQAEEMLANGMSVVKADTVNKMHSEIKERCIKGGIYPAFVASTIDRIAKEMLEGTND